MAKRILGKVAIGIFNEGNTIQIVKLLRSKKEVKLLDAEIIKLKDRASSQKSANQDNHAQEASLEELSLDAEPEVADLEKVSRDDSEIASDEVALLSSALSSFAPRNAAIAVTIAEPEIYYANFESDYGLKGKKLIKRITDHLSEEKGEIISPKANRIGMFKLANDTLQVAVRDNNVRILELLHLVKNFTKRRLPPVYFVETMEISLVNLVRENYVLLDEEISAIIYVGYDHSRFFFLRGKNIFHVSQIVADGYNAESINRTIYSRILFEQDSLGLANIDNIFLAGKARETGVENYMLKWKSESAKIEEIKCEKLDITDVDRKALNVLPEVAVAMGAAWRALDITNKDLNALDLTPTKVKEEQKAFKLGFTGWILFFLVPLLAFFFTVKISTLDREHRMIEKQLQQKQELLDYYSDLQALLEKELGGIGNYESSIATLDAMVVGSKTYSSFFQDLLHVTDKVGQIWLTDLSSSQQNEFVIRGFSLLRSNISDLVGRLENATLIRVEVQKIREKTVYQFEMTITAPTK